jgi:uncharacterized protein
MRIVVRVSPGAFTTKVGGRYGDSEPPALIVRVTARAVDGKANKAAVRALADALGLPRGSVRTVSGKRTRTKVVEVESADTEAVKALLRG